MRVPVKMKTLVLLAVVAGACLIPVCELLWAAPRISALSAVINFPLKPQFLAMLYAIFTVLASILIFRSFHGSRLPGISKAAPRMLISWLYYSMLFVLNVCIFTLIFSNLASAAGK